MAIQVAFLMHLRIWKLAAKRHEFNMGYLCLRLAEKANKRGRFLVQWYKDGKCFIVMGPVYCGLENQTAWFISKWNLQSGKYFQWVLSAACVKRETMPCAARLLCDFSPTVNHDIYVLQCSTKKWSLPPLFYEQAVMVAVITHLKLPCPGLASFTNTSRAVKYVQYICQGRAPLVIISWAQDWLEIK